MHGHLSVYLFDICTRAVLHKLRIIICAELLCLFTRQRATAERSRTLG
jgi:hypothetical protein